ncbi:MAG: hypothetical protein ABSF24_03415 [Candidatus Bathyarchaeia archaeon]
MTFLELYIYKRRLHESRLLVNPSDTSAYSCLGNHESGNVLVFPRIRTLEVNYLAKLQVVHLVRPRPGTDQETAYKYGVKHVLIFKGEDKALAKLKNAFDMSRILTSPFFELYEVVPRS